MKKPFQFLGLLCLAIPTAAHSATTIHSDNFETTVIKDGNYANSADDGQWTRQGGGTGAIALVDLVPNTLPLSSGNEMRVGYKFEAGVTDLTLATTWDASFDYTVTINVRSFDTADTDGFITGNFIVGARNAANSPQFFGKNISTAQNAVDGWVTYTHTITSAELTTANFDGLRIFTRLQKSSTGTGDFMLVDNLSIVQIPEPSAALLGAIGALALLRRRR